MVDGGPADEARDVYLDLLRVGAIALVVVGHWLAMLAPRLRSEADPAGWATWAFQVMPVFFLVGGAVNAGSWQRERARGGSWSAWVRRRAQRLLTPLFALAAFWMIVTPLVILAGFPADLASAASRIAFLPVWFLGVYLAVIALAPWTQAAHERWGMRALLALIAAAAAVDLARRWLPQAAEVNVVLVWAAIHQLGYLWPEERLPEGPRALGLTLAGLVALLLLVLVADYPVRMVTLGEAEPNNANPPTIALLALALAQLGIIRAARAPATRWLGRADVQRALAAAGSAILTIFLWHMSAIVLTAAAAYATGAWPEAPDLAAARWPTSPTWIATALALFAFLVLAFRRFETIPARRVATAPTRALVGLAATLAAIGWVVRPAPVAGAPSWLVSVLAMVALLLGLALLGALPTRRAA